MANKFQIKRTTVSGRTPNTTNVANTAYIDAGELAINLTDEKVFSSNGTAYFEVGANLANLSVSGNTSLVKLIANNAVGSAGQVLTSNGNGIYWGVQAAGGDTVTDLDYYSANSTLVLTTDSATFATTISALGYIPFPIGSYGTLSAGPNLDAFGIDLSGTHDCNANGALEGVDLGLLV